MLQVNSLSVSYGKREALKDVSLSVSPGEIVALIGPNGAGKSTLIKAVSGVVPIKGGNVQYDGQSLTDLSHMKRARILAVVSQAKQLGGAFSVEEAVMLGRTPYMNWLGQPCEDDRNIVERAMTLTQIGDLRDRHLAELSGGEQQRVYLARALAQDTPLLLLDEPTTHLDLQHQVSFLSLVRDLVLKNELGALIALHDLNQVALYADRVAMLVDGQLMALGSPQEVLTAERIGQAYHQPVKVVSPPELDTLIIIPDTKGEFIDD
jgi:iron complex transport system ATP-binding protein